MKLDEVALQKQISLWMNIKDKDGKTNGEKLICDFIEEEILKRYSSWAKAFSIINNKPWTFDYDGNVQGGRTPATDAPVTVVAIGLQTAQYVRTTSTITRATGQTIAMVAALERNYSNPV